MTRLASTAIVALLVTVIAPSAAAEPEPSPFALSLPVDGVLIGVGGLLWIAPSLANRGVPGRTCNPCDRAAVNGLDRAVVDFESDAANVTGDVLAPAVPLIALAMSLLHVPRYGWRGFGEDAALIAETLALAGVLTQIVRHAVRRPRPFLYRRDVRLDDRTDIEATLSFFSGHTTTAFAAASAFAYIWSVRRPKSRLKLAVWIASLLAASSVGIMRVAAGEHFWTDVIVGAAVGTGFGIVVPALHRSRGRTRPVITATAGPGDAGLGLRMTF